uniref:DNA repair protein RAD51 homolog 3 n=1 Tax=Schistosoma haematobium TaxID=6185 RepID=A0A095AHA0_SCHHA
MCIQTILGSDLHNFLSNSILRLLSISIIIFDALLSILQACVNVQIPKWFSGLNGQALFLDTEGNFIPERVRQIASALADHCKHHYIESNPERTDESFIKKYCPTVESLMSGIHYIRITDHLKLLAVCRHLEQFCDQHPLGKLPVEISREKNLFGEEVLYFLRKFINSDIADFSHKCLLILIQIRLIVVDSIALPFRYDFDDIPQRNRLLASVTQMLLCVAGRQQAAVILTNQITTKFDAKNLNSEQFDCVIEEEKVVKEQCRIDQNSCLVPALGDSWGHICSLRVFLTRLTTGIRQVKLLKHPGRPYGVGYYQITTGGIRDLVQNNKCNKHLPE